MKKKILIICALLLIIQLIYILCNIVILPIKSSRSKMILVNNGGIYIDNITLRNYIDDVKKIEFVLEINDYVCYQHFQTYTLPKIDEGKVEITLDFNCGYGSKNYNLEVCYDNANKLYESGLLIYSQLNNQNHYNQYLSIVSGDEEIHYNRQDTSDVWQIITEKPSLKKIIKKNNSYTPFVGNWKQKNQWIEVIG